MTRALLVRLVAGIGVFGLTFVGGAALADFVDDAEPTLVAPEPDTDIAAEIPEVVDEPEADDEDAAPDGGAGAGAGGGYGDAPAFFAAEDSDEGGEEGDEILTIEDATSSTEPSSDDTSEDADDAGDLTPLVDFGRIFDLFFLDPCADGRSDECPDGEGATILGHTHLWPFQLDWITGRDEDWWRPCGPVPTPPEAPLLIYASHPALVEVEYWPNDNPSDRRSTTVDLRDPSSDVYQEWERRVELGDGPETLGTLMGSVAHCAVLDGIPSRGGEYTAEVTATSVTGEIDTAVVDLRYGFRGDRPPVTITPLNETSRTAPSSERSSTRTSATERDALAGDELDAYRDVCCAAEISIPNRPRRGPVRFSVIPLIEPNLGHTCSSIEEGTALPEPLSETIQGPRIASIPDAVITAPDYPYDPSYTERHAWVVLLPEGTNFEVCVWWFAPGARWFDPPTYFEREVLGFGTPDTPRVAMSIVDTTFRPRGEGRRFVFDAYLGARNCRALIDADGVSPLDYRPPGLTGPTLFDEYATDARRIPVFCDTAPLSGGDIARIDTRYRDDSGFQRSRMHRVPIPAPGQTEYHRILLRYGPRCGIVQGTRTQERCGYIAGEVTLQVRTYDTDDPAMGGAHGSSEWNFFAGEPFEAGAEAPLPDFARVDASVEPITSLGGGGVHLLHPGISVSFDADRPVTGRAILRSLEGELCRTADGPNVLEFARLSDRQAARSFTGLCPRQRYFVDLEVVGPDGRTAYYTDSYSADVYPSDDTRRAFTFPGGYVSMPGVSVSLYWRATIPILGHPTAAPG